MTNDELRSKYSDVELLTATIWGEARRVEDTITEEEKEYACIANTIKNRALNKARWPNDISSVILQRKQFSCWNENDANRPKMIEFLETHEPPETWDMMNRIAEDMMSETIEDLSLGANHYMSKSLYFSSKCPSWSKDMKTTAIFGGHVFLKG